MDNALKIARLQRKQSEEQFLREIAKQIITNPAVQTVVVVLILDHLSKAELLEPTQAKGLASLFTGVTLANSGAGAVTSLLAATGSSAITGNTSTAPPGTSWWDKIFRYDKYPWEN